MRLWLVSGFSHEERVSDIQLGHTCDMSNGIQMTTLKVPVQLRQRITQKARAEGHTVAEFLAGLLAEQDRRDRFVAVREAYARLSSAEMKAYWEEAAAWDVTLADGLE